VACRGLCLKNVTHALLNPILASDLPLRAVCPRALRSANGNKGFLNDSWAGSAMSEASSPVPAELLHAAKPSAKTRSKTVPRLSFPTTVRRAKFFPTVARKWEGIDGSFLRRQRFRRQGYFLPGTSGHVPLADACCVRKQRSRGSFPANPVYTIPLGLKRADACPGMTFLYVKAIAELAIP